MLVQIQGLNRSFLVGFALNLLSEINEAFSVTTVIDAFILAAIPLATKLMKPSEPHHVYGYAATVTLPTTHLYHVILCWTYLIHLDFIHHLQLRPKPLYILTSQKIKLPDKENILVVFVTDQCHGDKKALDVKTLTVNNGTI